MADYQAWLKVQRMTQSMSCREKCLKNALIEKSMKSGKPEIKRPESGAIPNPGPESRLT